MFGSTDHYQSKKQAQEIYTKGSCHVNAITFLQLTEKTRAFSNRRNE